MQNPLPIYDSVQDKGHAGRVSSPTIEPDTSSPPQEKKTHHGSQTRRGQRVDGYLLKSEVAIVDRLKGTLTRRAEVSELIRIGLAVKLGKQQVDVILPPILEAIKQEQQAFSNRFMKVIAEDYYATKQGEMETQEILRLVYSKNPKEFHEFVRNVKNKARASL